MIGVFVGSLLIVGETNNFGSLDAVGTIFALIVAMGVSVDFVWTMFITPPFEVDDLRSLEGLGVIVVDNGGLVGEV